MAYKQHIMSVLVVVDINWNVFVSTSFLIASESDKLLCIISVVKILKCIPLRFFTGASCVGINCSNGGFCNLKDIVLHGIQVTISSCHCPTGYYGDHCQNRNFCILDKPCLNNGTCALFNTTTYQCSCPLNYFGQRCEIGKLWSL